MSMHISVVGSGYVGTTIAACFADLGHDVTTIDIDEEIVTSINDGNSPIQEPDLNHLIDQYSGSRLRATRDFASVPDTDVTFLALPTPSNDDGNINLDYMEAAAESVANALAERTTEHTVAVKSTVIPGTTSTRLTPKLESTSGLDAGESLHVGMNPEFLREGSAVDDFLSPDKLVLGSDDEDFFTVMRSVYRPLEQRSEPHIVETGTREAEMIKYANNAFLASKVSLINDIGNICKEFGVDTYEVAEAIGLDDRIEAKFLRSGLGWGGSCFPKDLAAITAAALETGYEPPMLTAAMEVNNSQPRRMLSLLDRHVDVNGERVAVLGLSFKPGTDDLRNARSIPLIEGLQERNANIAAYDPVATANMREKYPEIEYEQSVLDALEGSVAAMIVTEWPQITALDEEFDSMANPVVIDGRHAIDRRDGLIYEGLTW